MKRGGGGGWLWDDTAILDDRGYWMKPGDVGEVLSLDEAEEHSVSIYVHVPSFSDKLSPRLSPGLGESMAHPYVRLGEGVAEAIAPRRAVAASFN